MIENTEHSAVGRQIRGTSLYLLISILCYNPGFRSEFLKREVSVNPQIKVSFLSVK